MLGYEMPLWPHPGAVQLRVPISRRGESRLANGSLLECVEAVRDDPYRLGKSESDQGEE